MFYRLYNLHGRLQGLHDTTMTLHPATSDPCRHKLESLANGSPAYRHVIGAERHSSVSADLGTCAQAHVTIFTGIKETEPSDSTQSLSEAAVVLCLPSVPCYNTVMHE